MRKQFMKTTIFCLLLIPALLCRPAFCGEIQDAAKAGDLEKVKALLRDSPGLVMSKDSRQYMPLHLAVQAGHKDMVELLLANKAEDNTEVTAEQAGALAMRLADKKARTLYGSTQLIREGDPAKLVAVHWIWTYHKLDPANHEINAKVELLLNGPPQSIDVSVFRGLP
jgi:hypothetical protein